MKVCSGPLQCPICDVTLRPETIATHYEQELERVRDPPPPSHKKKKQRLGEGDSVRSRGDTASNPRRHSLNKQSQSLVERANSVRTVCCVVSDFALSTGILSCLSQLCTCNSTIINNSQSCTFVAQP